MVYVLSCLCKGGDPCTWICTYLIRILQDDVQSLSSASTQTLHALLSISLLRQETSGSWLVDTLRRHFHLHHENPHPWMCFVEDLSLLQEVLVLQDNATSSFYE